MVVSPVILLTKNIRLTKSLKQGAHPASAMRLNKYFVAETNT
jgi:hypothetical protein